MAKKFKKSTLQIKYTSIFLVGNFGRVVNFSDIFFFLYQHLFRKYSIAE
jgi:hypothetical protein